MTSAFPSHIGTPPPRKSEMVSSAVLDLPESPLRDDSGSAKSYAWVLSLFREPLFILRLYGLPFSGLSLNQHMHTSSRKDRRCALLTRTAAFVFPTLCAAYTVHCAASLLLVSKRGTDAMTAVLPDASDLCRAVVSFLTATHAARNGAKVLALVRQSAAAMFGRRFTSVAQCVKPTEWSALRRTVLASSSFALVSWAVFVGLRVSTLRSRGLREYCDTYLYGFAPSSDNRCGDAVICFVFGVPWIMARADVDDPTGYAAASVDVTLGVLLLVALFVAASEPGLLAKDSLTPHVLRLSCCQSVHAAGATGKENDVALNQELLLLATAVRAARVEMTGWNCFDVHRGTTITVLSMLATYAVIVYQMLHHIG
ncbi:hypothetical protein V5799_015314 [Amblyomma americanum]|uniref:Uncharacterized protein n=1 Tax=Amblyomma americanum TaxID=6943 RepID=A0AAQ4E0I3_AMBAM